MATQQFQRELRRWRTRKGLTQRALADRVRFSRETVAAVEAGRRYGSHELAVRCDEVLGTGGLLTALWPRVAVEQIAADGRRGPRTVGGGRAIPADPEPDLSLHDPRAVVEAIDELRELIDRMMRIHTEDGHHPHVDPGLPRSAEAGRVAAEPSLPSTGAPVPATEPRRAATDPRRLYTEAHRRGRVGAAGRRH